MRLCVRLNLPSVYWVCILITNKNNLGLFVGEIKQDTKVIFDLFSCIRKS